MRGAGLPAAVVTGMGMISSIGGSIKEFAVSLKNGSSGITFEKPDDNLPPALGIAARIPPFSFDERVKESGKDHAEIVRKARLAAKRSSRSLQCSVLSMMEAWEQAGLHASPVSADRIGIVVAGSNVTQSTSFGMFQKFTSAPEYVSPSYALQFMDTNQVAILSEIFDVKGESFSVGGASASGNVGLIKAMQMIQLGLLDICVVIGPLTELSDVEKMGFYNLGALGGKQFEHDPKAICRPFDKKHDGFIVGEGSACIVVESLHSARQRNAQVLMELASGAIVLDANRLSNPDEDGEIRAMRLAMERAGVARYEIDYINAHATSTPIGDITEVNAICKVLGKETDRVWVNSTKSLTGHCMFAAGVVEAVATMLQAKEGFVHPNVNLSDPIDDRLMLCSDRAESVSIKVAMSNSFGFGGINTSIIFRRGGER